MFVHTGTEFFLYYIIPQLVFFVGILGNLLGLIASFGKRFQKVGPSYIYRYLFLFDTLYLLTFLKTNLQYSYGIDLSIRSRFVCKTYTYFLNSIASMPPMLLVYISIERFLCLNYPEQNVMLRNYEHQTVYLITIVVFNFLFYSPILYIYDINETLENIRECSIKKPNSERLPFYMVLTNRIFFPFLFLFISSLLLVYVIVKCKKRVPANFTQKENLNFKRDSKLAYTSAVFNLIYICLNLPVVLLYFILSYSDFVVQITANLIMINYSIKFYLIMILNYQFRKDLIRNIFHRKLNGSKTNTSATFNIETHL